ncbi:hypothetical protein LLG96_16660 [bacterium]|nr:hypothetical protein [bacterium]
MGKSRNIFMCCVLMAALNAFAAMAEPDDLFRTLPAESPAKGILRISNATYYSSITANSVLKQRYGVTESHISSIITTVEFGITNNIAVSGSFPYYADLFTQDTRKGQKTGGGDISAGVRFAYKPTLAIMRGLSFGSRFVIPEKMVYGHEPLGFRQFSTGEFAYTIDASCGMGFKRVNGYFSMAMQMYPNATMQDTSYPTDVFYDTGFGYRGIGMPDDAGYSATIFQNQFHTSFGAVIPINPWLSGLAEYNSTGFISRPQREDIDRIVTGFRIGKPDRINAAIAMDFRVTGQIPVRTVLFKVNIPSVSPRGIKRAIKGIEKPSNIGEKTRAKNSFVAVKEFSRSDITYLYETELRKTFQKNLESLSVVEVVPGEKVDRALQQKALVPLEESPTDLGVRLGANYIINADVSEYSVTRKTGFTIPLVVGFPQTDFTLKARASVIDLVTGETHDLGMISATVFKKRGLRMFPLGKSSDIIYLSEPERRSMEKQLIDEWVNNFNKCIIDHIDLFDWDPKRTIVRGDEDIKG